MNIIFQPIILYLLNRTYCLVFFIQLIFTKNIHLNYQKDIIISPPHWNMNSFDLSSIINLIKRIYSYRLTKLFVNKPTSVILLGLIVIKSVNNYNISHQNYVINHQIKLSTVIPIVIYRTYIFYTSVQYISSDRLLGPSSPNFS